MSKKEKDSFGDRMKFYEKRNSIDLITKQPIIIRLDGKSFHTFTKGLEKPFSINLTIALNYATKKLIENIDNIKFAYLQSDEISLLLCDWDKDSTEPYCKNTKSKLESLSASIFTYYFNEKFKELYPENNKIGFFDSRAFTLPFTEVDNYFIWRQQDCIKNAISMIAYSKYSAKQLQNLSTTDRLNKLLTDGFILSNIPKFFLNGRSLYKVKKELKDPQGNIYVRNVLSLDNNIPLFKENREFITRYFKDYFDLEYFKSNRETLKDINFTRDMLKYIQELGLLKD